MGESWKHTRQRVGYFWPLAPPVAVAVVGFWILGSFGSIELPIPADGWIAQPDAGLEAAKRFWVAMTFLLLLAACAVGAYQALKLIGDPGLPGGPWQALGAGAVSFALVAVAAYASHIEFFRYLGRRAFETTLGAYPPGGASLTLLGWLLDVGNVAAILASSLLAAALCKLAPDATAAAAIANAPDAAARRVAVDRAARQLSRRVAELKRLLFAAALVLVAGMLFMKAWHDWPLAFARDKGPTAAAYQALSSGTLYFLAFQFALVLAALVVPMGLKLRAATAGLRDCDATERGDPAATERWLQERGLVLPLREVAERLLAVVSPFLAPPLVELAKSPDWAALLAKLVG